jgi:protein Tex
VHQDGLVHVSAMSKTFVKDPRSVVKPGDIVRVKVLEVDQPRKRISLTLRLDDEIGTQPPRSSGTERVAAKRNVADGPSRNANPPDGALADALRRAGLRRRDA